MFLPNGKLIVNLLATGEIDTRKDWEENNNKKKKTEMKLPTLAKLPITWSVFMQ